MGKWSRVINYLRSIGWSSIHRSSPSGQFLDALVRSQQFRQSNDGIVASANQTMLSSENLLLVKITKPCYIQKPLGTGGDFWKLLQLYTITILQLWNLPNPARVIVFSLQTCFLWLGFRVTRIFWKKPLLHRKHDYKTTNKMYQNVSTWILALHCGWTVSIFTSRKDKSYQLLGLINTFTHLYGGCYHGYTGICELYRLWPSLMFRVNLYVGHDNSLLIVVWPCTCSEHGLI